MRTLRKQELAQDSFKYDAFLSYSHAADRMLVPVLHSELHRFAKPWYRRRATRIFRDETGLAANPALWESIRDGLKNSRLFILLASPAAAASPWIEREVAFWLDTRSPETILIAVTDGEIAWNERNGDIDWAKTTALPRSLAGVFENEPHLVDLRFARDSSVLSSKNPDFAKVVARLSAAVKGRDLDDLIGEDVREHRKFKRWVWSAIVALVALTLMSITSAWVAFHQRNEAVSRELAATALGQLEFDPELSVQLAARALHQRTTPEAEHALRQSLAKSRLVTTLLGHKQGVKIAVFSDDGKRLFTFGDNGSIGVWNSTTGKRISSAAGHAGGLAGAQVSPDGARAILFFYQSSDRFVELPSGKLVANLPPFDGASFSPNGKWFATYASHSNTAIGNSLSGALMRTLPVRAGGPRQIAFSPNSESLIVAAKDGWARTYDVQTGQEVSMLGDRESRILSVTYCHDGRHVVTTDSNNRVAIWNVSSGDKLMAFGTELHKPTSAVFTSDGHRIISSSQSEIAIWQAKSGELQRLLPVPGNRDGKFALSPDTEAVAVASWSDDRVWVSRTRDGSTIASLRAHPMRITGSAPRVSSIAFSPDGKRLVTSSVFDNVVRIWRVEETPTNTVLRGHSRTVNSANFSSNGKWVVTASWDGTARIWEVHGGEASRVLRGHEKGVKHASFSSDNRYVVTVSEDRTVRVWNIDTDEYRVLGPWNRGVRSAAFSPDGTRIVTAHDAAEVFVWNAATGRLLLSLPGHGKGAFSAIFAPDGRSIITAGRDATIRVWDAQTGKLTVELKGHTDELRGLAFNITGEMLLSVSQDKTARLWDTRTWTPGIVYTGSSAFYWGALSADGRLAMADTYERDRKVMKVWEVSTGRPVTTLPESRSYDTSGAFNKEGNLIVVPGSDNTAIVWDVEGNEIAAILHGHTEDVVTAEFSQDGRLIVTGGEDGTAIIYPWSFITPIPRLKSFVDGIAWEKTREGR